MTFLYRELFVWKRLSNKFAFRYVCFENLATHKFHVQNCDWVQLPVNHDELRDHTHEMIRQFVDCDIEKATKSYSCLEDAINAFDKSSRN